MIEIFDFEQNTPEWYAARSGIPTASMFGAVKAKGKSGGDSKTRETYLYTLLGERITGEPSEGFSNAHTERGHMLEDEARNAYSFLRDAEPTKVGFVRNGKTGASPDSLIGEQGLLEIKTKLPKIHLKLLLRNKFPPEHMPQVQGQLWICEREWCDFVSYWPKIKPLILRVYRDEEYINNLKSAVTQFCDELDELEARYRSAA